MDLDAFSYHLPEDLIAQDALEERTASRLLVIERSGEAAPSDHHFRDLPELLDPSDVVVVNRSRVVPARLLVYRTSGARIEVLYLRALDATRFSAWVRGLGKLRPGEVLCDAAGEGVVRFVRPGAGEREAVMEVIDSDDTGSIEDLLDSLGHVPLPPYIRRPDTTSDHSRYQTVFARERGSVAAPTAGLHFDDALIARLERRGIDVVSIVLHVGPGTFSPLDEDVVENNRLHGEHVAIDADAISRIAAARRDGRRIVAVGTTVTRALESAAAAGWFDGEPADHEGETNLFIFPGYTFEIVEALITNFHLPRSSLLVLVAAFLGRERTLEHYRTAVARRYRFYSYGDAMLIR
jgi:S-adenosylmethionine:tRNA ribosyltransferase-isomerase